MTGRSALLTKRFEVGLPVFLLGFTALNALIYQQPLYKFALGTLEANNNTVLALLTLFVLQALLSLVVLGVVALLSIRLAKWLAALLVLCNSMALYFVVTYKVTLDSTMMGNALNTRGDEAFAFFHWKLLAYVLLLGALPAALLLWLRVKPLARLKRLRFLVLSVLLCLVWMYANAKSWLWIDRYAKPLGGLILPWSYIVNTGRYVAATKKPSEVALLPAATVSNPQPVVVLLVIGESARAQNFSLYGYPNPTNPELAKIGVTALPNAQACATYTTQSLRCMLSHLGAAAPLSDQHEGLPSYAQRHGVQVAWLSNNFGEPAMKVAVRQGMAEIEAACKPNCTNTGLDDLLSHGLQAHLKTVNKSGKSLIVLHQTGSHGPQYFRKHPPAFEKFTPACKTVDQSQCTAQELTNAYDNTIVFTDHVLAQAIAQLKSLGDVPVVMLYMSDHGESLGEYGLYLHGTPYAVAPDVQKKVPFIVWMSDSFAKTRGLKALNNEYVHTHIFHSVLSALGLTSPVYRAEFDIFKP